MNNLKFLFYGFGRKRLVTTIYLIQLTLAVTIGLQVYQVIDASIGHSVSLEGIRLGNAHMVINDLLNVHGASLSPLIGQVRWLILTYLLLAAFIHAGMWYTVIHRNERSGFWIGGSIYFGRCVLIGIIFLVLLLILSAIIWLPFLSKFGYWMEHLMSEAPLVWGIGALLFLWSVVCVHLFVASCYSRIYLIRDKMSVFRSVLKGIKTSVKKTIFLLPALMLVLFVLIVLYALHSFIDDWRILSSSIGIIVLFIIQQIIIWIKISLRLSTYHYLLTKAEGV